MLCQPQELGGQLLEQILPMDAFSNRINHEFNACNVIEMPIDHDVVAQSYAEVQDILGDGPFDGVRVSRSSGIGLYSLTAEWNGDLRWVSSGNQTGFAFFQKYFDQLNVANRTQQILGDCGEWIMYSGFFVIRSHMTASHYHNDYSYGVGMNALTLMTPITSVVADGHLLYEDRDGNEQIYEYALGKAVSFGSDFYHSTQPFTAETPYHFLCFTYGLRNAEQWDLIAETVAEQGIMYRHPTLGIIENPE